MFHFYQRRQNYNSNPLSLKFAINKFNFLNINNKNKKILNPEIRTDFDHRIAMSFAVLGSKIGKLHINESESISTSFPTFKEQFNKAGGNLS